MNIAIVSPYDWDFPGGVNRHVEQLSRYLRERGHRVIVVAPGGKSGEGFCSAGGSFAVSSNRSVAHLAFGPRVAARIKRLLAEEDFDLLHLHEPFIPSLSLLALLFSRSANLATFHAAKEGGSMGYRLARPLLAPLSGKLHLRAAVSPAAMELVARYFPGEYRLLPNGVDTQLFSPRGPALEGREQGEFHLLFVGRDEPRKGLDVLLRALPLVRERRPDVRLLVVGSERRGEEEKGVTWLGRLPDRRIPAAYRSARIMVSPALGGESFGIVLLEAMACGLPVVASDIPGYRTLIEDDAQGLLTPPGDAAALADSLVVLLNDEARRERMAKEALRKAEEYSWHNLVEKVEEAYGKAVERRKREAP